MSSQLELFHVQEAYAKADKPLSNEELYDSVAELAGIPKSALNEQSEIGKAKIKRSKLKRQIRWCVRRKLFHEAPYDKHIWRVMRFFCVERNVLIRFSSRGRDTSQSRSVHQSGALP